MTYSREERGFAKTVGIKLPKRRDVKAVDELDGLWDSQNIEDVDVVKWVKEIRRM